MTYINPNPNFSIVLPGGCNARCKFCFWQNTAGGWSPHLYRKRLREVFEMLPRSFLSCSITGGEPTISLLFHDLCTELRDSGRFGKVVLTTNGAAIMSVLPRAASVVTHLNISRHRIDDAKNAAVFGTTGVPSARKLRDEIIPAWNAAGIPVTLSKVLSLKTTVGDCQRYIKFAQSVGASQVFFRKLHGDLDLHKCDADFFGKAQQSGCPVCMTRSRIVRGVPVIWKYSLSEPSDVGQHELVMQQNGDVTWDWAGKKMFKPDDLPMRGLVPAAALKMNVAGQRMAAENRSCDVYRGGCGGMGGGCYGGRL